MLRKVKIELLLINMGVFFTILFFFFTGTYMIMRNSTVERAQNSLQRYIVEENKNFPHNPPFPRKPFPNLFHVKIDKNNLVISKSYNFPLGAAELKILLYKVLHSKKCKGIASLNGESYRYLVGAANKANGDRTIAFVNTESEKEILSSLINTFTLIGMAGLALVLLCSWFLSNKALVPIKESIERQNNFIADASHELRTPLTVISTNLEAALSNCDDEQRKWLLNIDKGYKRMALLVDDLLFLVRHDSKESNNIFAEVDISLLVKDVIAQFELIADKKKINLVSECKDKAFYICNEHKIRQLIAILVDNALKYTSENGKVTARVCENNSNIEIDVIDNGIGISIEQKSKIFERFYRVDKDRRRNSGGYGLGLPIAECIVKEHHGSIQVFSEVGKGSTFKILLPQNINNNKLNRKTNVKNITR